MIRRAAYAAFEIAEILHQQVARAVLPDLEIVAARVDGAEDARKRLDEQVVLADVAPHLLPAQRAGREALEVARLPKGALRQQLGGQRVVPGLGRHGWASWFPADSIAGGLTRAPVVPSLTWVREVNAERNDPRRSGMVQDSALKFQVVEGWEQLPAGYEHRDVAGVAVGGGGRGFLICRRGHPIIPDDRQRRFPRSLGQSEVPYTTPRVPAA